MLLVQSISKKGLKDDSKEHSNAFLIKNSNDGSTEKSNGDSNDSVEGPYNSK